MYLLLLILGILLIVMGIMTLVRSRGTTPSNVVWGLILIVLGIIAIPGGLYLR